MASWDHGGGFLPDAFVRIERPDRAGLAAAAARSCSTAFALERLEPVGDDALIYCLSRSQADGSTQLCLKLWN
jgi:hypothetical protein